MTIKASGTLWASEIRDEFSGGNPFYISDYYRGGPRVPNVSTNNAIPTSGIVYWSNYYSASAATLTLSPSPAYEYRFRAEPAPASLSIAVTCTASGAGVSSGSWSHVSGATFTLSNANALACTFTGTVPKNSSRTGVYRFTANNGLSRDVTVNLVYETDL